MTCEESIQYGGSLVYTPEGKVILSILLVMCLIFSYGVLGLLTIFPAITISAIIYIATKYI